MKKIFTLSLLLSTVAALAQIPAGYYDSATGTGYTLKTQLYNIIKDHDTQTYGSLYSCYAQSDRDYFYENDGTLLDIYSEKPAATDAYNYSVTNTNDRCGNYNSEGDCFNREHIMPQSVFSSDYPMYSDAHHVLPTDGKVNGDRGNLPFGRVGTANLTTTNGSKRGNNLNSGYSAGYSDVVFEPIDEFKGDVARALLYFATRYQDQISGWSHPMLNGTGNQVFTDWSLQVLLTWHNQDPVSERETVRNDAVYDFQDNRNPFVDHPEYVTAIWGTTMGVEDTFTTSLNVYPNPAVNNEINIYSETALDEIQLININGQIIQYIKNPASNSGTYKLNNLPQGFYMLRLTADEQSVTKKIIVN